MFFLTVLGIITKAQQLPHYTQYIINGYILNPAIAGIENYTDVKLSHRHQWVGVQDAPVTTYFTVQAPIGKKDYRTTATSFDMVGENPRGQQYWDNYTSARPHHGIGLKIINDKTGPLNRFSAFATYAYHIGIGVKTSLAAGFDFGMNNLSLQADKLVFDPNIPGAIDPAVGSAQFINKIKPDLNAGLYLYSSNYFVGLSIQQIIPQKIYFANNQLTKYPSETVPHLFASAGYRFFLNDDVSALPSAVLKYVAPLPVQFDLNMKLQYRDLMWIGGSYRQDDGFAAMVGLNISHTFNISYSYDRTTSGLNTISKGTHEIVLGFLLGNKFGDWCPRNVW